MTFALREINFLNSKIVLENVPKEPVNANPTFFPSKFVEDIKTINGKIYLSDDSDSKNEMYFTNISNFFKLQNQLFERLNYNLKNFYKMVFPYQY